MAHRHNNRSSATIANHLFVKMIAFLFILTAVSTASADKLILPSGLEIIGEDAFSGNETITEVVIPEGVTDIGTHAFGDCPELNSVILPGSVTSIGEDIFEGSPNVVASVPQGSIAEEYCEEYDIEHESIDDPSMQNGSNSARAYNGHWYLLVNGGVGWSEASAQCEAMGGHLVTITSQQEQTFVETLLTDTEYRGCWLGGYRSENGFTWVTGEEWSYTKWANGQPDNYGNKENRLMMFLKGTNSNNVFPNWNDYNENSGNTYYTNNYMCYICEWDTNYLRWSDGTKIAKKLNVSHKESLELITINTNAEWYAAAPTWITLSPQEGNLGRQSGEFSIAATILENTGETARTGRISIYADGCSILYLEVVQDANLPEEITISSETWNLGFGESVKISVQTSKPSMNKKLTNKTYSSADTGIATIDSRGKITAGIIEGQTTITVTVEYEDQVLKSEHTLWVWGEGKNAGFTWHSLDDSVERADKAILPKWNVAWAKIQDTNARYREELENDVNKEIIVAVPLVATNSLTTNAPKDIDVAFKNQLAQEFADFDFDSINYSIFTSSDSLVKKMLEKLIDTEEKSFVFKVGNAKYTAQNVTHIVGEGAAWYTYRLTAPDGKYYDCSVTVVSSAKIKLSLEYMKALFIREYNQLYDTVKSGALDMVGVNTIKDYVTKWIKGKGVEYLDENGKQFMDKFGTHVQELDTIKSDISNMSSFDLTEELPRNVVQKVAGYQNKIIKFIQDVESLTI